MVLRTAAALAASSLETVVSTRPDQNKKESSHGITQRPPTTLRIPWLFLSKRVFFLAPPFPRPPPLGREKLVTAVNLVPIIELSVFEAQMC